MNEVTSRWLAPTVGHGVTLKTRPINLLAQLVNSSANGCLQIASGSVSWSLYLDNGKITYASHSVQPFERLDLHLRRLGHQVSTLIAEVRDQVQVLFGSNTQTIENSDYRAICWLVNQRYLNPIEATTLIEGLIKEVVESFLLIPEGSGQFTAQMDELPKFCRLDLLPLVNYCRHRLQRWQALNPQIWSPDQRPYLFSQTQAQQKISPELQQKLGTILKGFSFRHIAALLNKDELAIAEGLQPYIVNGIILLREPKPPFDLLPRIPTPHALEWMQTPVVLDSNPALTNTTVIQPPSTAIQAPPKQAPVAAVDHITYTIACIDDSPTILNEMRRFLNDESFRVFAINDPLKALIQVIRLKPDLILLDIGMPSIDGYKLCRLLRNHSLFTNTPIIMVTGNTGIIDRAKAKFAGASDYLTKPFTQSELLKVVFRHLT